MADQFLALLDSHKAEIQSLLPTYLTAERFFTLARTVEKNPALRSCTPQSLFECVLKSAQMGLELGGDHCYVIPYKNEATLQVGYKGLIFRLVNAGVIAHMYAEVVRKGDEVEIVSGTDRRLVHKPAIFGERGAVIGVYSVATLPNGIIDFEVMELRDIDAIKKAALRISGGKPSPAWEFFPDEMMKKSVIRRHAKRLQGDRRGLINESEAQRLDLAFSTDRKDFEPEPDDIPTARQVNAVIVDSNKMSKEDLEELNKPSSIKIVKEDRTLNDSEVDELFDMGVSIGMKRSGIVACLKRWSKNELSDFSELRLSQRDDFIKAMQTEAAS